MKSIIIKMGIAHSIPRHERIGLSEPVRKPREKKERKVKRVSSKRKRNTKRKVKKQSRRTSPVKKRR